MARLVKNLSAVAGDLGLIPGLGRSPKEGKDYLSQYSGLENSMDCRVHGVAKSWARLSDFSLSLHFIGKPVYGTGSKSTGSEATNCLD